MTIHEYRLYLALGALESAEEQKENWIMGYETERFTEKQMAEFIRLTEPLVAWLNRNGHPHMKIIVLPTYAEIVEGIHGESYD